MDLGRTQALLARLYTEPALRARFIDDPAGIGAVAGLSEQDARWLAEHCGAAIASFGKSLVAKRRVDVAKLLPRTCRVLGQRFRPLFARFARNGRTAGARSIRDDAEAFAAAVAGEVGRPSWIRDLARFEGALARANRPGPRLIVRTFRWQVTTPVRGDEGAEVEPRRRWTCVVWLRWRREGRLGRWVFSCARTQRTAALTLAPARPAATGR